MLSDNNNLFATRLQQNGNVDMVKDNPKPEPIPLLTHGIAPRPLPSSELHETDNDNTPDTNNSTPTTTENPNNDPDDLPLALRKPQRTVKPTTQLQESTGYMNRPMVNHIIDDNWIPRTFKEAMRRPDLWWEPMATKIAMLKAREVFEVVPRREEQNVVGSKWVYVIKWKEDGGLERQKTRTVAKGFTQVIGEDYEETYASISHLESICLVCAIAASRRLRLWQIDFVSVFFNSDNSYEVFMEQPRGFEEGGDNHI